VVNNFLQNRENYGKNYNSGRPSVITSAEKRRLIRSAGNSFKTASQLLSENNLSVGVRRVQQILSGSQHLKYKKMKRKPMLSKSNIEGRRKFALDHLRWEGQWQKIIFSDEKKFNLDGPDGFAYYWHDLRTEEKIFSSRQSGGGSVMIWGAIGYLKKMPLSFISTRMNAEQYQQMIRPYFPSYGYECAGVGWQFQQDNAPIHAARSSLAFFEEHGIHLFNNWPAKSPDMNIIENIWGILAREVYKNGRQYNNKDELTDAIVAAWQNIPQAKIKSLYDSLPRRILALYDAKGKHTKY
jgi:DDE superfamily endonuclease